MGVFSEGSDRLGELQVSKRSSLIRSRSSAV